MRISKARKWREVRGVFTVYIDMSILEGKKGGGKKGGIALACVGVGRRRTLPSPHLASTRPHTSLARPDPMIARYQYVSEGFDLVRLTWVGD